MLDRNEVLSRMPDAGRRHCRFGGTTRPGWKKRVLRAGMAVEGTRCGTIAIHVGDVCLGVIFHPNQCRREASDLRLFGHNQSNRLAAEPYSLVIQRAKR